MKIDFSQTLRDFRGDTIPHNPAAPIILDFLAMAEKEGVEIPVALRAFASKQTKDGEKPLTLKDACVEALMHTYQEDRNLKAGDKLDREDLATRIWRAKEPINLGAKTRTMIQEFANKFWSIKVFAPLSRIIDADRDDEDTISTPKHTIPSNRS